MSHGGSGLPPQTVVTQTATSSNSNSGVITGGQGKISSWYGLNSLTVKLIVTAVTGSVTIAVEDSADGSTGWTAVDTFPAQSGTTTGVIRTIPITSTTRGFVRVSWTIVTGPVSFSVVFAANPAQMP